MKIACFLIEEYQGKILKKKFNDVKIFRGPLSRSNINLVLDSEILVSRARGINLKFNRDVLSKFKSLKGICSMSTGIDYIDLDYCNEKRIEIINVSSYSENSVAEHTFALILAIAKKIPKSTRPLKSGFDQDILTGLELKEKTLGIIGSGRIGLEVIRIAKGFGMDLIVYDVIHNNEAMEELGFEYVELDELLDRSDIVSVHIPYNKDTFHLLNKKNLSKIKKGAILVNTSRGEVVEGEALLENLKNGRIKFAGLDVLEREHKANRELLKMKNVLATPHNAANTVEARKRMIEETIKNISLFVSGGRDKKK